LAARVAQDAVGHLHEENELVAQRASGVPDAAEEVLFQEGGVRVVVLLVRVERLHDLDAQRAAAQQGGVVQRRLLRLAMASMRALALRRAASWGVMPSAEAMRRMSSVRWWITPVISRAWSRR
jgi:hypothetical protein